MADWNEIDALAAANDWGDLEISLIREAAEILEAVGASGVELPGNWRWPLIDELHSMAALAQKP